VATLKLYGVVRDGVIHFGIIRRVVVGSSSIFFEFSLFERAVRFDFEAADSIDGG